MLQTYHLLFSERLAELNQTDFFNRIIRLFFDQVGAESSKCLDKIKL
jgi:hypothetical protein